MNTTRYKHNRRATNIAGFTLVELMIVVVIIAVLAAVAIPSYQDSMRKSRRADAQGALQQLRQAMERHYTKTYSYQGAAAGGADTGSPQIFATQSPVEGGTAFYQLTISAAANNTFTLTATPVAATGQNQDLCGTLTLTNTGVRTSSGAGTRCWED